MAYKVQLAYFRLTGKFLTYADLVVDRETLAEIWEEIHDLRRVGRLPGLRTNSGRDLFILVDVFGHPQRVLHLVMPPFVNEDDVTPVRVPTGEMQPLVRIPLEELELGGRTTTRDIVKVELDDDDGGDTPVDRPVPDKPLDEP
jgi:hypothetical protein